MSRRAESAEPVSERADGPLEGRRLAGPERDHQPEGTVDERPEQVDEREHDEADAHEREGECQGMCDRRGDAGEPPLRMIAIPAGRIERGDPAPAVGTANGLGPDVLGAVRALSGFVHGLPPFCPVIRARVAEGSRVESS